ncbi:MAG TPA: hypothetical protein VGF62_00305 [Rhizomicrobium sp.]
MPYLTDMTSKIARFEGDPKIISTGPSSLSASDRLGKALGWFSFGLGLAELVAPRQITRALGMEGKEALVRAYGAREIGAGVLCLSVDRQIGLWNRVAGDGIDVATLLTGMRSDNPKRDNVMLALAVVLGVTALDVLAAQATTARHRRNGAEPRRYNDRSGYPKGIRHSRGAAKEMAHALAPTATRALTHESSMQGTA